MNSNNDNGQFAVIVVDDEELYCPDDAGWQKVKREHRFLGKPLAAEELLWPLVQTSQLYPELRVALGRAGRAFNEWRPYVIMCVESRPTRIHLQVAECGSCGWTGIGGTTAEPDLFVAFGAAVFQEKYLSAQQIPACLCPLCRRQMPPHLVWCAARKTSDQ